VRHLTGASRLLQSQTAVAKGASFLYAANIVVLLANTGYFLFLTHVMAPLDVGVITSLNIMITLLVTVSILAQPIITQSPIPAPMAVLKFLPEVGSEKSNVAARMVFKYSLTLTTLLSGAAMFALLGVPSYVVPFLGGQAVLPVFIRLAGLDVLVMSMAQICLGTVIALGEMKKAGTYIISSGVAKFGLATLLQLRYAIVGILAGFIIGDLILLILALSYCRTNLRETIGNSKLSLAELSRYSAYTLGSALMGFAISQADKIFALAQEGLPELAVYNVAIVASNLPGFAPYALLTALLPALSALRASGKRREMRDMIRAYSRYVSMAVLPIAFGFASLSDVVLRIFGPEYAAGFAPSVIVTLTTGLTAIGLVYAGVLLAVGELRWYTGANVMGLVALFTVSALLTPVIGLVGPALGRASLRVVASCIYVAAAKRSDLLELDLKAFLSATGSATIMGIALFGLVASVHSFTLQLALLPLFVVLGAVIYVGSLRALRLITAADVEFIMGIMPSRFAPILNRTAKIIGIREQSRG